MEAFMEASMEFKLSWKLGSYFISVSTGVCMKDSIKVTPKEAWMEAFFHGS